MESNIIEIVTASSATIAFFVALVISLVEVIKRTLDTNPKYSPVFAIVLGLVFSIFLLGTEFTITARIIIGIIIGLTSSGLYSSTKKFTE